MTQTTNPPQQPRMVALPELPLDLNHLTKTELEATYQSFESAINNFVLCRDNFVDRLDTGAAIIETDRAVGKDVSEYEDYWITLLRRYEAVCEKLRIAYANRDFIKAEQSKRGNLNSTELIRNRG